MQSISNISIFTSQHLIVNRLNNRIAYFVDLKTKFKIKNYEKIIFIVGNELNLYL